MHHPKTLNAYSALIIIFPACIHDSTVIKHARRRFTYRAVRKLLHITAVRIDPIKYRRRKDIRAVAKYAILTTRRDKTYPAVRQITRVHVIGSVMITPLIFLNQFRFIILRKSQLLQTAAVNVTLIQPIPNIIRALPAEHDFLRVKRKIKPSKNSALKSLDNIFNFTRLKIDCADIAKWVGKTSATMPALPDTP